MCLPIDERLTRLFAMRVKGRTQRGQSTIEAVFVIPIVFVCALLLMQPAIVLYDRVIMASAASEACRLLCTLPSEQYELLEGFALRRLAAVPQQDCFHVHDGEYCSWTVTSEGSMGSERVSVTIENKVKPLPLIDIAAKAVGAVDGDGCWTVTVEESMVTQPTWAWSSSAGDDPADWVGDWL